MNPHAIHARNCGIVKRALEKSGYKCEAASPPIKGVAFIVTPPNGGKKFKVQVRSRLYFFKNCQGKNLRIAFPDFDTKNVYVYPHDKVLSHYIDRFERTKEWRDKGSYHMSSRSPNDDALLVRHGFTLRT